ncbi:10744_t:CDS:1 [Racocetra fulgida]|uniref:10744_t:CDS:1 n=1 Tax=Racocetra fulgida TaxID=60492 RepID=A0A9N9HXZ8_9GLOM|nr:10744_t:CDS:1 [Racocetra fulgida]
MDDNTLVTDNSMQANVKLENEELGPDIPFPPGREQKRVEIINKISGFEFNINHIIGAGICSSLLILILNDEAHYFLQFLRNFYIPQQRMEANTITWTCFNVLDCWSNNKFTW